MWKPQSALLEHRLSNHASLERSVEAAWEVQHGVSTATTSEVLDAVEATLKLLDRGAGARCRLPVARRPVAQEGLALLLLTEFK
jgi:hypothetical protein